MGYFRKLWCKAKKRIAWKRYSTSKDGTIDTEFGCISRNGQVNDVFDNQDCLEQVLSFLTCKELVVSARTCKTFQFVIFQSRSKQVNVNMVWHGAENALTKFHDTIGCFGEKQRFGRNAREHCHLFTVASRVAEAQELSAKMDEIEENRIMIDGVLANLMKVRGFDAKGVVRKRMTAAESTEPIDDDAFIKMLYKHDQLMQRNDKRCKMAEWWAPPKGTDDHAVFVRVTGASTEEVICQGFCDRTQKLSWDSGLEFSDKDEKQGLDIWLDFVSLNQAEEIQSYLESCSGSDGSFDGEPSLGVHVTAVVVNRKDFSCRCLFQQDLLEDVKRVSLGHISRFGHKSRRHRFHLEPLWGDADTVQLGPSPYIDSFSLKFALSLNTMGSVVVPVLEVFIEPERTELCMEMLQRADHFVDNVEELFE